MYGTRKKNLIVQQDSLWLVRGVLNINLTQVAS